METNFDNYNNKENISFLNLSSRSINQDSQYSFSKIHKKEEEKNNNKIKDLNFNQNKKEEKISIKIGTENILNENRYDNYINDISLKKNDEYFEGKTSQKDNISTINSIERKETPEFKKMNEKEELLSNEFILDEINLRIDYEKIENELNKYKNINNNENKENDTNIKKNNIEINKNEIKTKDDKYNSRISINSNFEGDLFYYSDEEEDINKKINYNNEKIKLIQENLDKLEQNSISNIDTKNNIEENNNNNNLDMNIDINNNNNVKIDTNFEKKDEQNDFNKIDKNLIDKIEYGIDENGNPISIKYYNEEKAKNKNIDKSKKIIAYIIESEKKGNNYLIDLKGNIIPKINDEDFNYKYDNIHIVIKNFDVQNPKLRIFGERQKYSSIILDERNNSNILKKHNSTSETKNFALFNHIKDNNISNKNKGIFKSRQSPILNRNNYSKKILNENKRREEEKLKMLIKKYNQKKDNKRISHYNKNKRDLLYRKIPLQNIYNTSYFNLSQKFEKNFDSIIRTSNILNQTEIRNTHNNLYNSGSKNISFKKSEIGKYKWRNYRTPPPYKKEIISSRQDINNDIKIDSYINCKYKKDVNRNYSNYKNLLNLNVIKLNNNNKNNPLIKINDRNILKNSHSSFFNKSNSINNSIINKSNDILLKKSQSTNNNIAITINNIENNIKQIENKIQNTIKKISKNNSLNKNNIQIKSELPTSSTNSKRSSINEYPYFFNYSTYINRNDFKLDTNDIYNNNTNEETKTNIRRIPLNKKFKISTSPKKNFQCSVLSKEASEMITDFTNRSLSKNNNNNNTVKKITIYEYMKNDEPKNKIKSYTNKDKINIILYDYSKKNINNNNKNWNKNKYLNIKNKKIELFKKNEFENNKNNNSGISGNSVYLNRNIIFNKFFKKNNNVVVGNKNININKKNYNKSKPIHNNSCNNIFIQKIKPKQEYNIFNLKEIIKQRISARGTIKSKLLMKSNSLSTLKQKNIF